MYYKRITKGLEDKGKLVECEQNMYEHINDYGQDWYFSIYEYNQDQFNEFQSTKSVKGVTDVTATQITWDFDSKESLALAKEDAVYLVQRLEKLNVNPSHLRIAFSGQKGFEVTIFLDKRINVNEYKAAWSKLADGLATNDLVVCNPSRVFRAVYTKHQDSGLYKIPLTYDELKNLNVDDIRKKARSLDNVSDMTGTWKKATLPDGYFQPLVEPKKETTTIQLKGLDFSNKPKWLSNCRWALQNGFFAEGKRNSAFLCLASTYKNLGFELEHVYRLLKGVAEIQAKRNNSTPFSHDELWDNIVMQVFNPSWKGGQFSCKDPNDMFLHSYCRSLGSNACKHDADKAIVELTSLSDTFKKYTNELDKNKMTTGIYLLDQNVLISTSMLVGLLAAPSAGKTQTTFEVLNNCSKNNISNMFFSMDMGLPLVYTRLVQKHFGIHRDDVFDIYKNNPVKSKEIDEVLQKEYNKTKFCFKGGLNCEEIREAIIAQQEKSGEKVKFVAVDYLECIAGPYSDSTANTAIIAQKLKDIANELETCIWLLLQTQKSSGDPSDKLMSMRNVKGASVIEQACSVIVSLSRPGFAPRGADSESEDHFITISTVKDRMGPLVTDDCYWDGLTGAIRPLTPEERGELAQIRERKKNEKAAENGQTDWV